MKYFAKDSGLDMPNFDDEHIVIYKPKQRTGTYFDSDYFGDDKYFATLPNAKTAQEISSEPQKYICGLGYFSFGHLIDMNIKSGASYIHSASEPYNEEQVISEKRLNNWIKKFGFEKHQIHCSGHAKGLDLLATLFLHLSLNPE